MLLASREGAPAPVEKREAAGGSDHCCAMRWAGALPFCAESCRVTWPVSASVLLTIVGCDDCCCGCDARLCDMDCG